MGHPKYIRKIGIIILNYNSWHDTVECVAQFWKQNYPGYFIIIVDNASADGSVEKIRAQLSDRGIATHFAEYGQKEAEEVGTPEKEQAFQSHTGERVALIKNNRNLGYPAGNNVGIRYALKKNADALLIVNPDVRIEDPDTLNQMVDTLFSSDDIFAVGPNVIDAEGIQQSPLREPSFLQESTYPFFNVLAKGIGISAKGYLEPIVSSEPCEVTKIAGCCLILRASFLKEAGLLDEAVFLYCEESILADQVKKAKGRLFFVPSIVVRHLHKKSVGRHWEEFIKSRRYYLSKYRRYSSLQVSIVLMVHRIISILVRGSNRRNTIVPPGIQKV